MGGPLVSILIGHDPNQSLTDQSIGSPGIGRTGLRTKESTDAADDTAGHCRDQADHRRRRTVHVQHRWHEWWRTVRTEPGLAIDTAAQCPTLIQLWLRLFLIILEQRQLRYAILPKQLQLIESKNVRFRKTP